MKSIIKENQKGNETFPVIKIDAENRFAVLFTGKNVGMVVWVSDSCHSPNKLGYYSEVWLPYNHRCWLDFNGKIELSN